MAMLALVAMASACGAPVGPYQFRQQILYPPLSRESSRPARIAIKLGAACGQTRDAFAAPEMGFEWSLAQRRVDIVLSSNLNGLGSMTPVTLLRGIEALHRQLDTAVALGCLTPERERGALRRAAESLPLSPFISQQIVLGAYVTQKFIELGDPVELQMTYALDARHPDRYDLGYVARTFRLYPSGDGRGALWQTGVEVRSAPRGTAATPVPVAIAAPGANFYRLVFLYYLRQTASDRRVALLTASSRAALVEATAKLVADPRVCESLDVTGARCLLMPPDVGLEARLRITVQGRNTTAAVTATLATALAESGVRQPEKILPTLKVLRPYRGGYAPVVAAPVPGGLLGLLLSGGERISW
jgi:hypothetical protein